MINELARQVHENAKSKGFFDEPKNIGEMLCLIHSEVSEALEADRMGSYCRNSMISDPESEDGKGSESAAKNVLRYEDDETFILRFRKDVKDSFEDELADVIIRVMDLAAFKGIDLEQHIKAKMRFNSLREHKHGKKY